MNKVELLAPAGNMTKLKTAFLFGADAVYLGGSQFGLRAKADNFSFEEIEEAVKLANSLGKKIFVTLNILPREDDLSSMVKYAKKLHEIGVHAVIISDIGLFNMVHEEIPELDIHISTQANTLNSQTIKYWVKNGASRVNLARELSLEEISKISYGLKKLGVECDLEAFVHGSMCMAYSGRCLISDFLTGRSSNRGDCTQPCRWKYHVVEEKRPGEYMPLEETDNGTFMFNSKDLCMVEHIDKMIESGVTSLKIEGRMKSEFYTAIVVRAYRLAIDEYYKDPIGYKNNHTLHEELVAELSSVSHRDYSTGFYLGDRGEQVYTTSSYIRDTVFIGTIETCEEISHNSYETMFYLRGDFNKGDTLEFVTPEREIFKEKIDEMYNAEGESLNRAAQAMTEVRLNLPWYIKPGSIIRKRKIQEE